MNLLAVSALWIWLPIVLMIFALRPAREAVVVSFVIAWLFLPNVSFDIPGFPNWTKMSATVTGLLLGVIFFDLGRLFSLRAKWYDLPMIVWCVVPFLSSLSSGAGAYDGFSAVLDQLFAWGFPYLLGRVYFADETGARQIALWITIGGLLYVPLCLIEMRFSPMLMSWVYGIHRFEGYRLGGYRPTVFLQHGLELGMWMTCATFTAFCLWFSGAIKRLWGLKFLFLTLALAITTVLCRSTGALCLLLLGSGVVALTRFTKKPWLVWALVCIPPLYTITRTTGLWSGYEAVQIASSVADADRAQSLEFRFQCETNYVSKAMLNPIFGASRDSHVFAKSGALETRTIDGFWIATFITSGLVGLTSLIVMMILPLILTARRYPARRFIDPEVAPVVALGVMLVLFMIDSLFNAMLNPLYALVVGSITALQPSEGLSRFWRMEETLEQGRHLADHESPREAEECFEQVLEWCGPAIAAEPELDTIRLAALEGLAPLLRDSGRDEDAIEVLREALTLRLAFATETPTAELFRELAAAHETLARALADAGRPEEAVQERRKALELWAALLTSEPRDALSRAGRVAGLNDLAWLLANETNPLVFDPTEAVSLASESTRLDPMNSGSWNTLGVALYRAGDWMGTVEALEHSLATGEKPGGTAFDHYFLSMASRRLGEVGRARDWFDRAIAWSDRHLPGHPQLEAFRAEAATLLVGSVSKLTGPRA